MLTTGSKFLFGLAALVAGATLVYGWGSRGGQLGVLSLGLRGGIGEHSGYLVLVALALALAFLGIVLVAFRDADPDAVQAVAGTETLPEASPVRSPSYWPAVGAFGVVLTLVGLVVDEALFVVGLLVGGVVAIEWLVEAWSDRATGDAAVNRQIRNRIMLPIEVPAIAAIAIVIGVLMFSRVLLALPANGSSAVAIAVAAVILGLGVTLAYRPAVSSSAVVALLALVAVALVTGGIVAAAVGERDFEEHHVEDDGGTHEGAPPIGTVLIAEGVS
jgi:hypothetical protein